MAEVTVYKDISNERKIQEFLQTDKTVSVFQTQYFLDLYNKTKGLEGILFVCHEGDEILGVMLTQVQNYFGKMLKTVSSRSIIIGGPIVIDNNEETGRTIIDYYVKYIRKKVVYTQVRNMFTENKTINSFDRKGFQYEDHINYIINLREGEDELWKKLHSKRRNEVRKASKEGITFSEINYENELGVSYAILEKIYSKARLPLPDYQYFRNAYETMGKRGILRIFGGYYENKLVGVMYTLCYNGIIYDWYAGSEPEYLTKCPNDLITWEVFKWGIENKYTTFDFGGAGNPKKEYGVRDFKKKFGGMEVNAGRYEMIHKRNTMRMSKIGFKVWQSIKHNK